MTDITTTQSSQPDNFRQLIWGILLLAFGLFCLICVGSSLLIYTFFFESTLPIETIVQAGQGTVVITDDERNERGLRSSEEEDLTSREVFISTDGQSQGTLTFRIQDDELEDAELLITLTLGNNAAVRLNTASRPRFVWSEAPYTMNLSEFRGEMDVFITGQLTRPLKMQINAPHGEYVDLIQSGRYSLTSTTDRIQVSTITGEAILHSPDNRNAHLVLPGQEGTIYIARSEPIISELRPNIISNGLFTFNLDPDEDEESLDLLSVTEWQCNNNQSTLPEGAYQKDMYNARTALRLVRSDGANTNGETRCSQNFTGGYSLEGSNYMEIVTTFLLNYQSISRCGEKGSECPLTLYITYTDVNGNPRDLYRGFYYANNLQFAHYKARCDSCRQDHQQINEKVWYTYQSGNLFTSIPEDLRPARIDSVEFYASGHEYDVFISEISLFAGVSTDAPVPPAPIESTPAAS